MHFELLTPHQFIVHLTTNDTSVAGLVALTFVHRSTILLIAEPVTRYEDPQLRPLFGH